MKVRYWIEGNAVQQGGYQGEIEVGDEELAGKDGKKRDEYIQECVAEAVNDVAAWGWEAVEDG